MHAYHQLCYLFILIFSECNHFVFISRCQAILYKTNTTILKRMKKKRKKERKNKILSYLQNYCDSVGAYLVRIETMEENEWITKPLKEHGMLS